MYMIQRGKSEKKGAILIALIVFMVMAAMAFTVAVHVLGDVMNRIRTEDTRERLRYIEESILGHPYRAKNDAGGSFGYFSRWGDFPADGVIPPIVGRGFTITGNQPDQDGFGNPIITSTNAGNFIIESYGINGANAGGDDIEFSFPRAPRNAVAIQIEITDATLSGCQIADDTDDAYYGLPGTGFKQLTPAGDVPVQGSVIFDNNDLQVTLVSAPFTQAGVVMGYAANAFTAANVRIGWHEVRIVPINDLVTVNNHLDPKWFDRLGVENNALTTMIYVSPRLTAEPQRFEITYPVVAATVVRSDTTAGGSDDAHYTDKTIKNPPDINTWTNYSTLTRADVTGDAIPDPEFHAVGNVPDPDFLGDATCRVVLRFNNLPAVFPHLVATSKIVNARLRLYAHSKDKAQANLGYVGAGALNVSVYKWTGQNWDETQGVGTDDPFLDWGDTAAGTGYNIVDRQGEPWPMDPDASYHDWDVTKAVRSWVATPGTEATEGFIVVSSNEANGNWWLFKGFEQPNDPTTGFVTDPSTGDVNETDKRPKLIITYYP